MLSQNQMVNFRKVCETMYDHVCDIYGSKEVVKDNCVTTFEDTILYKNQPCHVSQTAVAATSNGLTTSVTNVISLFISPDITIPEGSRIVWNGKEFHNSGVPAMYGAFQKIQLDYIGDKV